MLSFLEILMLPPMLVLPWYWVDVLTMETPTQAKIVTGLKSKKDVFKAAYAEAIKNLQVK